MRCEVHVGFGGAVIELDRCITETVVVAINKGVSVERVRTTHIELAGVAGAERSDGYTDTLRQFGYRRSRVATGLQLSALRQLDRRWWLGGFAAFGASPDWTVPVGYTSTPEERVTVRFDWTTFALGALGRLVQPCGFWASCATYVQLGAGMGLGFTRFTDANDRRSTQRFRGWSMTAGAGVQVDTRAGVGLSLGYQLDYAPLLENTMGETHASGGHRLSAGVSYAY